MTESASGALGAIVDELARGRGRSDPLPRARVLGWMDSEDLETAGTAYHLIMDEAHYTRIQPPLRLEDYVAFLKRYYSRCVLEDPIGEWADSRYEAAWGLRAGSLIYGGILTLQGLFWKT